MIRFDLGNWLAAILAVALWIAIAHGYTLAAQRDMAKAETAQLRAEIAAQDAQARRKALETELRHAADMQTLGEKLTREMQDAQDKHAGVVAGLERGTLRLRAHWQGCIATGDLSRAAAAAARADENARLRAEGAAAVVRAGAECDARIRAWQSYARAVTEK